MDKITYDALHDVAYKRIMDAIRDGRFAPGQVLKTRSLADLLGVSSTPVREAITRLTAQNVLELAPRNRGATVPHLTRELLDEMYELRLLLEPMAAEQAAELISNEQLAKVVAIFEKMKRLKGNEQSQEFRDRSEEFSLSMFRASGKPILVNLIENLWLRSHVILGLAHKPRPKSFSLMKQRQDCLDALQRHDGQAAANSVREILTMTRDMVYQSLGEALP